MMHAATQAISRRAGFLADAAIVMLELFGLLLLVGWITLLSDSTDSELASTGFGVFMMINWLVVLACSLFVPIYVAAKFAAERSGVAADLLYTTTISPISIVLGKITVSMMLALLLVSCATPYMVLSYLLRGIDLPTIGVVLVVDILIITLCSTAAIMVAALNASIVVRVILGFILFPFLFVVVIGSTGMFFQFYTSVSQFTPNTWLHLASTAGSFIGLSIMFASLAVSMISSSQSDRAWLPRLVAVLLWGVSLFAMWRIALADSDPEAIEVWATAWIMYACIALTISSGGRRTIGIRLRRQLPRFAPLRAVRVLFMSGVGTGVLWSTLLGIATLAALAIGQSSFGRDPLNHVSAFGASLLMYTIGFTLIAIMIYDRFLEHRVGPSATAPLAIVLVSIMSAVPVIVGMSMGDANWELSQRLQDLSPFGTPNFSQFGFQRETHPAILASGILAFGMIALRLRWLFAQLAQYRPVDRRELAGTTPDEPEATA